MLSSQRTGLLIACIVIFLGLGGVAVYRAVDFNRGHFYVGAVPQSIVNELLPKDVPIDSIRPPALRITDPIRYGSVTSVLSVIEYGDFQCDFCRVLHPDILRIVSSYGGRVRFVWHDFPIEDSHKDALDAAVFARCAGAQGRYWEAADGLMQGTDVSGRARDAIASRLRLDRGLLSACERNPDTTAAIRADEQAARADGIQAVPFIFVGTKGYEGTLDATGLKDAIETSLSSL